MTLILLGGIFVVVLLSREDAAVDTNIHREPIPITSTNEEGQMSDVFPLPLTTEELTEIGGEITSSESVGTEIVIPSDEVVPTTSSVEQERFVVGLKETSADIADNLYEGAFISDKDAFSATLAAEGVAIAPGGYHLSKNMAIEEIVKTLKSAPYMVWVVIPEGLRKEEIADVLADALGWSAETKMKWIDVYSSMKYDYVDGVYFPDTYLLPIGESPLDTTNRILAKFNEKFAPYLPQFSAQNIKWTTGLTLASIVQREAASDADMTLIAGILWNRLEENMALGVDATLQYVRGDTGNGFWAPASSADKKLDSPYNTYLYKGLPPHPIANPGLTAIEAVLDPAATDCLYYLHDAKRVTHCAVTYDEHLDNIDIYLKEE